VGEATLTKPILVTGASGLIGRALLDAFKLRQIPAMGLDLVPRGSGTRRVDVRNADGLAEAVSECAGVVEEAVQAAVMEGVVIPAVHT